MVRGGPTVVGLAAAAAAGKEQPDDCAGGLRRQFAADGMGRTGETNRYDMKAFLLLNRSARTFHDKRAIACALLTR